MGCTSELPLYGVLGSSHAGRYRKLPREISDQLAHPLDATPAYVPAYVDRHLPTVKGRKEALCQEENTCPRLPEIEGY